MKLFRLYLFMMLLISPTLLANPSSAFFYNPQQFDVLEYHVQADMTAYPSKYTEGRVMITLSWDDADNIKNFYFHALGIEPDSVFFNEKKTTFSEEVDGEGNQVYKVTQIPSGLEKDIITIYYHGEMAIEDSKMAWGGVHFDDNLLYSMGPGFYNPEVSMTSAWFPCYDHPSDKATTTFEFTVPDSVTIVSNGILKSVEEIGDLKKFTWEMQSPAATYLLNFAASSDLVGTKVWEFRNQPVYVYSHAEDTTRCQFVFSKVKEMVEYQEKIFGDYPFEKIGFVISEKGSMEHQTMINIARGVLTRAYSKHDDKDNTVFHELTHQWFGNSISPKDWRNTWLNEGFAEFSETLWRGRNDKSLYLKELQIDKINYIPKVAMREKYCPLYNFIESGVSNYPRTIYDKGSLVLGLLRYEIGDENFFDLIKAYYSKFRYQNLNTDDFVNFVNTYLDEDLDWFFDQWVYSKGFPKLDIIKYTYVDPETKTTMIEGVKITQTQEEEFGLFTNVPFEISYRDLDNNIHTKILTLNEKEQYFDFSTVEAKKFLFQLDTYNEVVSIIQIVSSSTTTSVQEEIAERPISVYPTVAETSVNIDLKDNLTGQIKIYNAASELLDVIDVNYSKQIQLDVSKYAAGLYFVNCEMANGAVSEPFYILR